MIEKMTKYSFILLDEQTGGFLEKIQALGVMDINRSSRPVDEFSAEKLSELDRLKNRIAYLKSGELAGDDDYDRLNAELAEAKKLQSDLEPWGYLDRGKISALIRDGIVFRCFSCPSKSFDPAWAEEYVLEKVCEKDGRTLFVIAGFNTEAPAIAAQEVTRPSMTLAEAAEAVKLAQKHLDTRVSEIEQERMSADKLEDEYTIGLASLDRYLAQDAAEKADCKRIEVLTGFVPSAQDTVVCAELDSMDVFYIKEDAAKDDEPPVKLKNNRFVSMFEVLTDMYGRPAYDGFDPTPYISIFFMLFFAMCMGDAGYGIILVIVGMLLGKNKGFAGFAPLVKTLGFATLIIGLIFHTFFSMDIAQWSWIPESIKKCMLPSTIAGYDGTMVLSLMVGVVHICLALVVKTVYATKNKGFLGSLSVWGWTLLIVGGVITGGIALSGVIDKSIIKIIIIVLGCISATGIFLLNDIHRNPLINIGAGLWETYNTATGLLGDVLSYLRLYALGLAGAMLGYAFNDLAGMVLGDGGLRWIPFVLIVIIGHTLNIAMAALGAFVHPLRLNFLEFFKNSDYDGSGRNYNPLKK